LAAFDRRAHPMPCQRGLLSKKNERSAREPPDPRLTALAKVASMLQWPIPRIRDEAVRALMARAIDSVLASVSRGRGAVDIAIGERLDALGTGNRFLRLGYVSVGDYAREMRGIPASTAQEMARFARRLRDCPQRREAVRAEKSACGRRRRCCRSPAARRKRIG
jgi:hypothetical protein